jgi:hypothetical protein
MSAKNKAAKSRSQRRLEDDAEDEVYKISYDEKATFSNGVPRVVSRGWLKEIDGVLHYMADPPIPLFTDHRLAVDLEWKYLSHKWKEAPGGWAQPGTPLVDKDHGDYENSNQEALDLALSTQRELESDGHIVPVELWD